MRDSREAIFTIEFPDGRTYTGSAVTAEISIDRPVGEVFGFDADRMYCPGLRTWAVELRGIGPLTMFDNLAGAIKVSERGIDWECPYCGRSWSRSQHKCWDGTNGCGANRPAMWWVKRGEA